MIVSSFTMRMSMPSIAEPSRSARDAHPVPAGYHRGAATRMRNFLFFSELSRSMHCSDDQVRRHP